MPVQWEEITEQDFAKLPEPTKPGPKVDHEWEELISRLDQGQVVRLPFWDEKGRRGTRLSLGRRAARRGFKVEIRYGDGFIAARKSDEPIKPGVTAEQGGRADKPKPANGRRRRQAVDAT